MFWAHGPRIYTHTPQAPNTHRAGQKIVTLDTHTPQEPNTHRAGQKNIHLDTHTPQAPNTHRAGQKKYPLTPTRPRHQIHTVLDKKNTPGHPHAPGTKYTQGGTEFRDP